MTRVKYLPKLLTEFEIVVKGQTYTDAEDAALAVRHNLPMSDDIARAKPRN